MMCNTATDYILEEHWCKVNGNKALSERIEKLEKESVGLAGAKAFDERLDSLACKVDGLNQLINHHNHGQPLWGREQPIPSPARKISREKAEELIMIAYAVRTEGTNPSTRNIVESVLEALGIEIEEE